MRVKVNIACNITPSCNDGTPTVRPKGVKQGVEHRLLFILSVLISLLVLQWKTLQLTGTFKTQQLTRTWNVAWSALLTQHTQDAVEDVAMSDDPTNSSRLPQATSFQNSPDSGEAGKPWFVFHIGPPKTGTSTIQAFARERRGIMANEDNYDARMVLLTVPRSQALIHLEDWLLKDFRHSRFSLKVLYNQTLAIGAAVGRSVFVSDEHLAKGDFESAKWKNYVAFLQKHYRVRIVLLYRRYFDWLPSWYNQFFKYEGKYQMRLVKWPPMTAEERRDPKNGVAIPTFPDYFESTLRFEDDDEGAPRARRNPFTGKPSHNTVELHRRFQAQGLDVVIQNFHADSSGGDLLTKFFCHSVPEAQKMCELAKRAKQKKANKSDRDLFDLDLIAVEARRQGLIPLIQDNFYSRRSTMWKVKDWLKQTPEVNNALPRVCLSSSRTELLQNMSYEFESYMAPYLSPDWILDHNQSFVGAVSKGMFCSVDAKKVLQDERLRNHLIRVFWNKTAG